MDNRVRKSDAGRCCDTNHDELDIEIVTNFLQPGASPLRVQLNRYANEPLGSGHGPIVALPSGFDPLASHEWRIRWFKDRVTYFVDGIELLSATSFVPQGAMQANIIVWAPAADWFDAFHSSLQPVANVGLDQRFVALVDYVSVSETAPAANDQIISADMDGNGRDDVVIDFGLPYGIWVRMNNASWVKLHDLSPL